MTRSYMSPVNSILARHCLKLRKLPIERIAAHGLKQLSGSVHGCHDTAGNITAQASYVPKTMQFVRGKWGILMGPNV